MLPSEEDIAREVHGYVKGRLPDTEPALALAGAPLGAWIAVRGDIQIPPVLIGVCVLLWVAGFDVLYALQDVDFDRKTGLFSIPARFGVVPALWISAVLHAVMLAPRRADNLSGATSTSAPAAVRSAR